MKQNVIFISKLPSLFPLHQPLTRFSGHCYYQASEAFPTSNHEFQQEKKTKKNFFTAEIKEHHTQKKNQKTNSTPIPQMKNKMLISHRQAFWRKPGDLITFEFLGNYVCNQQPRKKSNTDQVWFKCKKWSFQAEKTRHKERTSWQVKNQATYKYVLLVGLFKLQVYKKALQEKLNTCLVSVDLASMLQDSPFLTAWTSTFNYVELQTAAGRNLLESFQ